MLGVHDLALFVVSGLVLNLAPGPDTLVVASRSVAQGWRRGSAAALGVGAGTFAHVAAAAAGLSALLASSPTAFAVLKWVGAAYLVGAGARMIGTARRLPAAGPAAVAAAVAPASWGRCFVQGLCTNVLNPKVALFFLAFVPPFIDAGEPHKVLSFLLLGCIFNVNSMLWLHAVAMASALAGSRCRPGPGLSRWLQRGAGGLFVAFGLRLAWTEVH